MTRQRAYKRRFYNLTHNTSSSNLASTDSQPVYRPPAPPSTTPDIVYINPAFSPTVFVPQSVLSTMEGSFVSSSSRGRQLSDAAVERESEKEEPYQGQGQGYDAGFGGDNPSYRSYGTAQEDRMCNPLQRSQQYDHLQHLEKQDGQEVSSEGHYYNNNAFFGNNGYSGNSSSFNGNSGDNNSYQLQRSEGYNNGPMPAPVPVQRQQPPPVKLINGVHPDRLALILAGPEPEQKATPPTYPAPSARMAPQAKKASQSQKALARKASFARKRMLMRRAKKAASTSIERKAITSSTTMNIMRRLATGVLTRSMVRTAVAARGDNTKPTPTKSKVNPTQAKVTSNPTPSKASISQGSTSTPAKDKASLLQLLMETAMMPGQLGQGSRDLLHVHRERLMAAGIEVPPEMAAILKDNDADKDHVPAPIDPRPYSVPVGLVSSTSAIHDMAQDRTRGPVRCSKKQERYQPYAVTHTGEGVSYVDGGEQSKLKGENGTLRESAYDPKTSMLLPNKRSASATPPQPSSLPLHRQAASLMGTTALATMAGGVGSNMTATGSPLGCSRDDILKQREAAMKKIVEFTMGLSLRAGPKD